MIEPCLSPPPPKPVPMTPRATNENTVTVYIPPPQSQQQCPETTKAIMLSPQPLKLFIDTPTDWPSVSTGALVALAVGAMAYFGQRNQVRAATANFRHGWQQELRALTAKFISVTARIHYELESNPDYLNSSESNSEYSQLIETHAKIELMLDHSKPYATEISNLTAQMIQAVKNNEIDKLSQLSHNLLKIVNGVLEQAWKDIRNDLRGKT